MMGQKTLRVANLLAVFLAAGMAWAGDSDHERARTLLEKGEILSLSEIMKQTSTKIPGKILEAELEEKDGRIVYEIEYLGENGVVMEMLIDARSGQLISAKED